jgi:hypothetical protein
VNWIYDPIPYRSPNEGTPASGVYYYSIEKNWIYDPISYKSPNEGTRARVYYYSIEKNWIYDPISYRSPNEGTSESGEIIIIELKQIGFTTQFLTEVQTKGHQPKVKISDTQGT